MLPSSRPWLTLVGVGADGPAGLPPATQAVVAAAPRVFGPRVDLDRLGHLSPPPQAGQHRHAVDTLDEALARLGPLRDGQTPACLLTRGDPMLFGWGPALAEHCGAGALSVVPQVSPHSLAAARLGWPLEACVLAHAQGAPLETILRDLAPGARFLIQARDRKTPIALARMLIHAGYDNSRLVVFHDLGGPGERQQAFDATDCPGDIDQPPDIIALDCRAAARVAPLGRGPGLPDRAFEHDDRIMGPELRAATLAALVPLPDALLWHVGAGCGDVAVEWMRAAPRARAVAFEKDRMRFTHIARNAVTLGVPGLDLAPGDALKAMAAREEQPDAVFLSGALRSEGVLETCWERLHPGGTLVANATTLEAEARLLAWFGTHGGDLLRFFVQRLEIGPQGRRQWTPSVPVTQYRTRKE